MILELVIEALAKQSKLETVRSKMTGTYNTACSGSPIIAVCSTYPKFLHLSTFLKSMK